MQPAECADARTRSDEGAAKVAAARRGDAAAFSWLVRRHQRRAVSVAYRLLGNAEDAADVVQDAFVRAHTRLGQLDDDERFGPWLMRIVTNLALNFRRRRGSRPTVSLEAGMDVGAASGSAASASWACDGGDSAALKQAIDAAIRTLPEKQAAALVLFSIEGMPQKEVAEVLDCSVELVKWNVFQARKKLKDLLADYL
ncbi:MAG: sigma-70 family RNA polymerase sigma factor [Phycisphaerales bacterium]|nr:MAG: sigma-70 family RNA polymerase sigma factor [Phycisphaerales bacterium]